MTKQVKEIYTDLSGKTTVEYFDDSIRIVDVAKTPQIRYDEDGVTAIGLDMGDGQTDPIAQINERALMLTSSGLQIGGAAPNAEQRAAVRAGIGLDSLGIVVRRAVLSNDITGLSGSEQTPITWDTGDFDPLEPTRIYVPPGFSHALVTGAAMVTGSGAAETWIIHSSSSTSLGYSLAGTASTTSISVSAQMWPVSEGDYFELIVRRSSSLTGILSGDSTTSFSLTLFP